MSTETIATDDARRELADVIANLGKRARDPEAVRRACEGMDRTREEIRQRVGVVDVAVELVREARDQ